MRMVHSVFRTIYAATAYNRTQIYLATDFVWEAVVLLELHCIIQVGVSLRDVLAIEIPLTFNTEVLATILNDGTCPKTNYQLLKPETIQGLLFCIILAGRS